MNYPQNHRRFYQPKVPKPEVVQLQEISISLEKRKNNYSYCICNDITGTHLPHLKLKLYFFSLAEHTYLLILDYDCLQYE
jgi:hypothetical protein